jgi:hypothetical protein
MAERRKLFIYYLSYTSSVDDLDYARLAFRELNRKLRKASFDTLVEFEDE